MEVNEYDTATLWRYGIETAVHVASQQKHSKQVDRLRWIVSRKIYAAAKGDCNEKVRRGNRPIQTRMLVPEGSDACGRQAAEGRRRENATNTRQIQPEIELKGENYSITDVSGTPADITCSIRIIARDSTDVFRSQLCNKNICWKRVES